ncbi:DUF1206 domain-containing protein [Marinimicrobium locisalis]|uniref:DUF1206 domain-containing protein n=1 Tax=Marinimicrobium locisalis TaxID=546022 RepID=UPI0032218B9C
MSGNASTSDSVIVCLARTGYAARGIVYLLVGGLATLAAFGRGGETTGSPGALKSVMTAPLGTWLLLILALGLLCYALWRGIQAIMDPDQNGTDLKGLAIRAGLLGSALSHLVLAGLSVMMIFAIGASSSGSEGSTQSTVNWLMGQPFGRWLVASVGLVIVGIGVVHHIRAWSTDFDEEFDMPSRSRYWAFPLFRFGLTVRGLVFMIVGGLFVAAAYHFNPEQAGGTGEALNTLRAQPFGKWLFATVAIGLFAFGAYSALAAVFGRVKPSN